MKMKFLDNKKHGNVIDSLRENIIPGSQLSIISHYFTIFAYKELQKELSKIKDIALIGMERDRL